LIEAWRLIKTNWRKNAFTGDGARLYGARWSSKGTSVVYTSDTLALATLEIIVNDSKLNLEEGYTAYSIEIPKKIIYSPQPNTLPDDWHNNPHSRSSQIFGDHWVKSKKTAVMKVPSAVIPIESNYIINISHQDFSQIKINGPITFPFDKRLINAKQR